MSKILVAEDNAVNRELMREMLEAFGREVGLRPALTVTWPNPLTQLCS